MNTNNSRLFGGIVAIIALILGIAGVMYAGAIKRIELTEVDVRRGDKNQGIIIYQLEDINKKLDRLLAE